MTQQFGYQPFSSAQAMAAPYADPAVYYRGGGAGLEAQQLNLQYSVQAGAYPQSQHDTAQRMHAMYQQHAMYHQHHPHMMAYPPQYPIDRMSHYKRLQTKAERRAEHNANERARRENLNTKFQQLAHSLPNLQNDRRPSKGTIIERTLDFVKNTVRKEEEFMSELRRLRDEHCELMHQLYPGRPPTASTFDFDEFSSSDGSCSPVEAASLRSASCPSLESSSTVNGSNVALNLFDTHPPTAAHARDAAIHGDVVFGQAGDGSLRHHYDSDDDNSSANIDDIDYSAAPASCTYPAAMMDMSSPTTNYMTKAAAPVPADLGFKLPQ